jgi:hypothetical protein
VNTTVAKTPAPMRRVPALVWGETVTIDCPDWCITDHTAGAFFKEDLFHSARKVRVPLPVESDGQCPFLEATLLSWIRDASTVADTVPPCVTISRGIVSELTGTIDVLNSGDLSALADTHDSAELRALATLLASEEARYDSIRRGSLTPAARWGVFLRNVCGGCRLEEGQRPTPARGFIVPAKRSDATD